MHYTCMAIFKYNIIIIIATKMTILLIIRIETIIIIIIIIIIICMNLYSAHFQSSMALYNVCNYN